MLIFWKLLYTGGLAAAVLVLAVIRQAPVYWLALAALVFSWLGDAAMAGFKPLTRGMSDAGLWGIGFFTAAHLLYILAFAQYMRMWPQQGWSTIVMVTVFAAAAAAFWWLVCADSGQPLELKMAALVYAMALFMMACLAWCSALRLYESTGFSGFVWPLALGSALFIISDGMIALDWFKGWSHSWQGIAVWATYAPAQLMLVMGFWMMRMPETAVMLGTIGL